MKMVSMENTACNLNKITIGYYFNMLIIIDLCSRLNVLNKDNLQPVIPFHCSLLKKYEVLQFC